MSFLSIRSWFNNSRYTDWNVLPSASLIFDDKRNNSAVNRCSQLIANTVASIPINLYKEVNGFKQIVKDDIRYKVLHYYPNGYTSSFDFWNTMELVKQKEGNSFAIIHRFPENKNIILEFVHPNQLYKKPYLKDGFLKYRFNTDNGIITIDANNIIHFKKDSEDGLMGIDPHIKLSETIERMYYANKTISNHYKKEGKGTRFLKTSVTTGDLAQLEKSVNRFRKESGGSYYDDNNKLVNGDYNSKVSFPRLPGDSDIKDVPEDQNDALYLATIKDCKLEIASDYGISGHYLNIMEAQKNNNVEVLQLDFKSATIQHTLRSNRQELEMKLLSTEERDNGMSIEYNTMAIMELDHQTRMSGYESLQKTAAMTFNEVRQKEGMPPIEGGDEHYIFDQFTTLNQVNKDASKN